MAEELTLTPLTPEQSSSAIPSAPEASATLSAEPAEAAPQIAQQLVEAAPAPEVVVTEASAPQLIEVPQSILDAQAAEAEQNAAAAQAASDAAAATREQITSSMPPLTPEQIATLGAPTQVVAGPGAGDKQVATNGLFNNGTSSYRPRTENPVQPVEPLDLSAQPVTEAAPATEPVSGEVADPVAEDGERAAADAPVDDAPEVATAEAPTPAFTTPAGQSEAQPPRVGDVITLENPSARTQATAGFSPSNPTALVAQPVAEAPAQDSPSPVEVA